MSLVIRFNAEQEIRRQVAEIKLSNRLLYNQDMETRHDYYLGDQETHLQTALLKAGFADLNGLRMVTVNITRQVVNKTAFVYFSPADRVLMGADRRPLADEDLQLQFADFVDMLGADLVMRKANRYARLFRTCFVNLRPSAGRLEVDVLPPYMVDVHQGDSRPMDLDEEDCFILLERAQANDSPAMTRPSEYLKLDNGQIQILDEHMRLVGDPIDTRLAGEKTMIVIHDELPDDELYLRGDADVVNANLTANMLLTDLAHGCKYQVWSQPFIRGVDEKDVSGRKWGPNQIFATLNAEADFQFVSPQADIAGLISAIEAHLKIFGRTRNLSPNAFTFDANAISAVAKLVDNQELEEERRVQTELYRRYERTFWRKAMALADAWGLFPRPFGPGVWVDVIHGPVYEPMDRLQEQQLWDLRIASGFATPIEAIANLRRVSMSQARRIYEQIQADKQSQPQPVVESTTPTTTSTTG